jgi:penicillin-binding protein 1B
VNNPNQDAEPKPSLLKRGLWRLLFLFVGLSLGIGIPYIWYLDKQVRDQFAQLNWQVPTKVYARPLELIPGRALDGSSLELELQSGGYKNDGQGRSPGTYGRSGGRFKIGTREFFDVNGPVPAMRLEVLLVSGRIASVREAGKRRALPAAKIDPMRIATLYGNNTEERRLVKIDRVPKLLVDGLQAVEDRNFQNHIGIDPMGVARAIYVNIREVGFEQGASTLTQQLVRSLFLSNTKTITRKVKEALYALIIEARFDKATILEAYLNQVYLGQVGDQSIHGIAAGADFWFGRDVADLQPQEIALLIGLVQGPYYWDPRKHPERGQKRRTTVLNEFLEAGLLTPEQTAKAKQAPLGVVDKPILARNRAPAFLDIVRRQLAKDYDDEDLRGQGLTVLTTLSPMSQTYLEKAVSSAIARVQRKDGPSLQAGAMVTDAQTGKILAAVGNRDTGTPGFNRALDAKRPVGSLLKPFVYMLALARPNDWSLSSWLSDDPIAVNTDDGKVWEPKNSDRRSHGTVTLSSALANSYNQATVRLGMQIGTDRLADLVHSLTGEKVKSRPSLLLGSVDLSVYTMAQMYQFLASGGRVQPLYAVRAVLDPHGKALNKYESETKSAQKGDAIAARLVSIALQQTVTSGTARALLRDGLGDLQSAGKTGTSNDSRDSWYAGYTGDHLAVVWMGNDKNESTGLYGATGAMQVWSSLFKRLPSKPLRIQGDGLEWTYLDASRYATTEAHCPGARRAVFVAGYLPSAAVSCGEKPADDSGSWLDWFTGGDKPSTPDEPPPADGPAPPADGTEQQ